MGRRKRIQPAAMAHFELLPFDREQQTSISRAIQQAARLIVAQDVGGAIELWRLVDHLSKKEGSKNG